MEEGTKYAESNIQMLTLNMIPVELKAASIKHGHPLCINVLPLSCHQMGAALLNFVVALCPNHILAPHLQYSAIVHGASSHMGHASRVPPSAVDLAISELRMHCHV